MKQLTIKQQKVLKEILLDVVSDNITDKTLKEIRTNGIIETLDTVIKNHKGDLREGA